MHEPRAELRKRWPTMPRDSITDAQVERLLRAIADEETVTIRWADGSTVPVAGGIVGRMGP